MTQGHLPKEGFLGKSISSAVVIPVSVITVVKDSADTIRVGLVSLQHQVELYKSFMAITICTKV